MLTRGREVMSLLRLLPGVCQNSDPNSPGSEIGSYASNIGGPRNTDRTVSVYGLAGSDADNVNVNITALSMDTVLHPPGTTHRGGKYYRTAAPHSPSPLILHQCHSPSLPAGEHAGS